MEAARPDVPVQPFELVVLEESRAAGGPQCEVDDLFGALDDVVVGCGQAEPAPAKIFWHGNGQVANVNDRSAGAEAIRSRPP